MIKLYPKLKMILTGFNRVKNNPASGLHLIPLLFIVTLLLFISCENEGTLIGEDLQPESDKFTISYYDDFPVEIYSGTLDSIRSDETDLATNGELNDDIFGTSSADFLTHIRLSGELVFDDYDNLLIDSLFIILDVEDSYGDTNSVMQINVHELKKDIYLDSAYYSNMNKEDLHYENVIGSANYNSSDTLVRIYLDNTFAEKIVADSSILDSQDEFLNEMKGLYFTSDIVSGKGLITNFKLLSLSTEVLFVFHYPSSDTLLYNFSIGQTSARINLYSHDFNTADPSLKITHLDDGIEDSVSYIKGLAGVYTKMHFPYLESWRDSLPIGINNAELTVNLSNDVPPSSDFPPPENLDLYVRNEEGQFIPLNDMLLGRGYFGGNLEDGKYSFTISDFVHKYLTGSYEHPTIYIFVNQSNYRSERAVLSGFDHSDKVKLEMTYTR